MHVGGEGVAPDVPLTRGVVVDTAHAGLGCVCRPQVGRVLGHDFGEVGRAVCEAGGEAGEGVDVSA